MLPRVILLDVIMPGMDGWSVLQALKADPSTVGIPVVMVSFVADASIGASLGAANIVSKPVNWTMLKGILDRFHDADGDVLVVDDDIDMRSRLRCMLEKEGWSVREAGDGAEALNAVMETAPKLILLDLTMPIMDGFAFLHQLRQTPGCFHIPVVVLTARDVSTAERRRLTEVDSILKKGETSMSDLRAKLRRISTDKV